MMERHKTNTSSLDDQLELLSTGWPHSFDASMVMDGEFTTAGRGRRCEAISSAAIKTDLANCGELRDGGKGRS